MLKPHIIFSTASCRNLQNSCKREMKKSISCYKGPELLQKLQTGFYEGVLCRRQQEISHEVTTKPNTLMRPEGKFQWYFCL